MPSNISSLLRLELLVVHFSADHWCGLPVSRYWLCLWGIQKEAVNHFFYRMELKKVANRTKQLKNVSA